MSATPDQGLGPTSEALLWETIELLTEAVDGIAGIQRETVEAFLALSKLQLGQQAVLAASESEADEAHSTTGGAIAQAHQSQLQSRRLVARGQELAARADQLRQHAEQLMNDLKRRRARAGA